jgi:hypothetical protein
VKIKSPKIISIDEQKDKDQEMIVDESKTLTEKTTDCSNNNKDDQVVNIDDSEVA